MLGFLVVVTSSDLSYTGTVHVASSDTNSTSFPFDYTFVPADNGAHRFTACGNAQSDTALITVNNGRSARH